MLEFESLCIGYDPANPLSGPLSFRMKDGECILLAGDNGSGKSTLLRTLAGLQSPLSGSFRSQSIRMVPTRVPKVEGFTVKEFVTASCYGSGLGWKSNTDLKSVDNALARMGITLLADRQISELSDGEFQKACIATALVRTSDILLLDEPTVFLDVKSRMDLLDLLEKLAHSEGLTVIIASHDIHDCLKICDRVMLLSKDGAELSDTTQESRLALIQKLVRGV